MAVYGIVWIYSDVAATIGVFYSFQTSILLFRLRCGYLLLFLLTYIRFIGYFVLRYVTYFLLCVFSSDWNYVSILLEKKKDKLELK